jgi:tetratricopeptide (TPR) repeat protein
MSQGSRLTSDRDRFADWRIDCRCRRGGRAGTLVAAALVVFSTLAAGPLASAQQPPNVYVEPNEQLFDMLVALNVAGYDAGFGTPEDDRVRAGVRSSLEAKNAPAVAPLKKFYAQHRVASDPSADLGQYISLALLTGPPPDFKLTVEEADLPPDSKSVEGLLPLLRTFYKQADLASLWARARIRYESEVGELSAPVRKLLADSDGYLRFPSGNYLGRTYAIYVCLLGLPGQVQARIYGSNYYLVATASKEPRLYEIRHQYLHFLLDPMALKYAAEIQQRSALGLIAHQAPMLGTDFKDDFSLLLTECLIRSIELRMDKPPKESLAKTLADLVSQGYILVPYYYRALQDFEKQDASMTVYYKVMVDGINVKAEDLRLTAVKFAPRPEPAKGEAAQARSEEERLLDQGDNLIYQAKYEDAKATFQTVLQKFNPQSERALYGLAIVYSNLRKPDLAEEYFNKTLESARDLHFVTWSHIYLGRIYDLNGERKKALVEYHAAALTAPAYPGAIAAVQNGLARPFGTKE